MEYVARKSNLVVPEGFVELDREEMTYVDGGLYISNSVCTAISCFCGMVTITAAGAACAASIAGINLFTSGVMLLKSIGAKIMGAIGAFCATNPWAIPIVAVVGAWAIFNRDNFLMLGADIVKAAVSGKGVECGVSWFQVWSNVN